MLSELRCISPYLVRKWENTDQSNYEYGHFSRSVIQQDFQAIQTKTAGLIYTEDQPTSLYIVIKEVKKMIMKRTNERITN